LHGALLMSGNHLNKTGETGLKPALVEKRWLATFIMICKLGLVQGGAEVLWRPGPGATAWLYALYHQMLILRNVKIQAQQNYCTCPNPCHMQKLYATKAWPQVRVKKRKNCPNLVSRCATIARHLNVVKIILHGTFDEIMKYVFDAGALLKRTWCFLNGIFAPKCMNSSERWSLWQIFCIISIFFTTIESEESIYDCIIANFAIGFT